MAIFGVIVWIRSREGQSAEGDGEMFYYLGFIYTLLTLVATFTPLLAEGTKPSTQQVLGLFGLGLITTFFGLAGRIFFLQSGTREEPDPSAARLARAYVDAARQIEATTLLIERAGEALEQSSTRSQEAIVQLLEKGAERAGEQTRKVFDEANQRIAALTEDTAGRINASLTTAATGLTSTLDDFKTRLRALKLPPAELGRELTERVQSLSAAINTLIDGTSKLQASMNAANTEIAAAGPQATAAASGLAALANGTQGTSKLLEESNIALSKLGIQADRAEQSLSALVPTGEKFSAAVKAIADNMVSVQKEVDDFRGAFASVIAATEGIGPALAKLTPEASMTADQLKQLVAAISGAGESASKVSKMQEALATQLQGSLQILRSHQEAVQRLSRSLEQDLASSEQALRKVHGNLVKATEFITSRVVSE